MRWGLLGTARIIDRIIEAVSRSERSLITSVASRDASRARSYAKSRGIPYANGDYARLPSFCYLRAR